MCLTETYPDIPQRYLVEGCALEHGIDFGALNTCASDDDGALGMGMLRDSVNRSSSVSFLCKVLIVGLYANMNVNSSESQRAVQSG